MPRIAGWPTTVPVEVNDELSWPGEASGINLLSGFTYTQQHSRINSWRDAISALPPGDRTSASSWGEPVRDLADGFWKKFSNNAVLWAAARAGVLVALPSGSPSPPNKSTVIQLLVDHACELVPIHVIIDLVQKAATSLGKSFSPVQMESCPVEVSVEEWMPTESVDDASTGDTNANDGNDGEEVTLSSEQSAMLDNLLILSKRAALQTTKEDKDHTDQELTVEEKHLKRQTKLVEAKKYVDVIHLSEWYLEHLRNKSKGLGAQRVELGKGMFLSGVNEDVDAVNEFGFSRIRDGFSRYVRMHAESANESIRSRVPDLLEFESELLRHPVGSLDQKARFIKAFLHKHCAVKSLVTAFSSDFILASRFLVDRRQNAPAPMKRKRDYPIGQQQQQQPWRRRPSFSLRPHNGQQRGPPLASRKLCYSRLKRDFGQCKYPNCKFGHGCSSCGDDHAAVDCTNWDQAKSQRALDAQKP